MMKIICILLFLKLSLHVSEAHQFISPNRYHILISLFPLSLI
ncbi:hypothetical protein HMPREF0765_4182 [Sphingobacterium spiritivorum ATCC 33300]|uniref:Uncharacterized protein n=1 Tax=Sphingobacterium spiritivorum ATCC 33300 TaxID=525372 RepID=C2G3M6_SPHSI|nr:hypothetical protein HMPREF0765_4182 [Sphingobacterium spiritivorum ATCC 33300]